MRPTSKIRCFFFVFGLVYILESIGGFYMTSAIVFIERQFQIPSRLSGTMVSAGDFAYIPVVLLTSYFGGKGNRAKWIGFGCMLISLANLLISSSNFLFPVEEFSVDLSSISDKLTYRVKGVIDGEFNTSADPTALSTEMELYSTKEGLKTAVRVLTNLPYAFCDAPLNSLRTAQREGECEANPPAIGPFAMIFGGLLILGVGRTMPFSLGLPLMDDNVKKTNLPIYFAIMFFAKILGPVMGMLIGGQLNRIYYNFKPPQGLTPVDPMWIGCWWMGFLLFGSLLFFPSLALFLFPSNSITNPSEDNEPEGSVHMLTIDGEKGEEVKKKKKHEPQLNLVDKHKRKNMEDDGSSALDDLKGFLLTMKSLVSSPIYMGAIFGRIIDVLAFKGFFVFLGKYVQLQFDVPQHRIQQYLALAGIMGFACGVATGSGVMKKFKLQGRKAAVWVAVCSFLAAMNCFTNSLVGCTSVTGRMAQIGLENNFTFSSCDPGCSCDGSPFYPVCNSEGEPFFSPCHGGCPLAGKNFSLYKKEKLLNDFKLTFTECTCAGTPDKMLSRDFCERTQCESRFKLFFYVQALGAFFGGMTVVPGMLLILRCVPPEHRSVSLGFNGLVVSLFATLPSPVLWGKIFDLSCMHWPTFCGDRIGACQLYDTAQLRVRIHLLYGGMRLFSLVSDLWVVYWAKGLNLMDEEEEEEGKEDEVKKEEEFDSAHKTHSRNGSNACRRPSQIQIETRAFEEEALVRTI